MINNDDFIVFGSPLIGEEEIEQVVSVIRSGWLGTGPLVKKFEDQFASYKSSPFSAAVSSCTAALHLSILAAGVQPGDEVITTPMTFAATVNAIIHAGGVPVLADIDPRTYNIDPQAIEEKITAKTKAIVPVHFAGYPCDMDRILDLSTQHNLKIIEDCAHAIETEYRGKKVGTIGDFGCCSFYVTKNITTVEGGMVLAKDEGDIARIKIMALHGLSKDAWHRFSDSGYKHYYVTECGFKYNMTDVQAAFGVHQLPRIDSWWQKRKDLWDKYNQAFVDLPISLPPDVGSDMKHGYHLYTLRVSKSKSAVSRDDFIEKMTEQKIGVGVHYLSLPSHPYYQERFSWKAENYPNAKSLGEETVSLPLSPKVHDSHFDRIVSAVREIVQR